MGTFGFWTAYLRPKPGEVIVADGYASKYHPIIDHIKSTLPEWKILADPCFSNLSRLHNNSIPELTPECHGKTIEYGIDETAKANKLTYVFESSPELIYLLFFVVFLSVISSIGCSIALFIWFSFGQMKKKHQKLSGNY